MPGEIYIKTKEEIETMRKAGKLLHDMLEEIKMISVPGMPYMSLENKFIEMCQKENVIPACKNYSPSGFPPFPTGLCVNVNEEAVHNYPDKERVIFDGDKITIDTVIGMDGLFVDHAITYVVGQTDSRKENIINTANKALSLAISCVKDGARIGDISNTIQTTVEREGFTVLVDYAGHGIGRSMHEAPEIPCFGKKGTGPVMAVNMTLAIETLVCEKSNRLEHFESWKTKTIDGGYFAQFEHTVAVTKKGCEILTI